MNINLPAKVRATLYVITAVGTPVIAVLGEQGIVPEWAVVLWSAEVAVIATLARFNVSEQ